MSKDIHALRKNTRNERFQKKIYGTVHDPAIQKNIIGVWDAPSYLESRKTSHNIAAQIKYGVNHSLDMRCFYTGVPLTVFPSGGSGKNNNFLKKPWYGTRDHLVPARRDIGDRPSDFNFYRPTLCWTSSLVNVTLGVTPMPVRLKIRQWLSTTPYDRTDTSVDAGNNMRWIIIHYLNFFRYKDRFFWSRDTYGNYWYPECKTLMNKMWQMEKEFLELDEPNRDQYIKSFRWNF